MIPNCLLLICRILSYEIVLYDIVLYILKWYNICILFIKEIFVEGGGFMSSFDLIWKLIILLLSKDNNRIDETKKD